MLRSLLPPLLLDDGGSVLMKGLEEEVEGGGGGGKSDGWLVMGRRYGFGQYTGMLHHTRRPSVGPSAQPAYLARVLFLVGVRFGFVVCGLLFFLVIGISVSEDRSGAVA